MPDSYPYVWLGCRCYVWPIALVGNPGRCGRCGEEPHDLMPTPPDGKAHPRVFLR